MVLNERWLNLLVPRLALEPNLLSQCTTKLPYGAWLYNANPDVPHIILNGLKLDGGLKLQRS